MQSLQIRRSFYSVLSYLSLFCCHCTPSVFLLFLHVFFSHSAALDQRDSRCEGNDGHLDIAKRFSAGNCHRERKECPSAAGALQDRSTFSLTHRKWVKKMGKSQGTDYSTHLSQTQLNSKSFYSCFLKNAA